MVGRILELSLIKQFSLTAMTALMLCVAPDALATAPQMSESSFDETMAWVKSKIPGTALGEGGQQIGQSLKYGNDRFDMVNGQRVPNPIPECDADLLSASRIGGQGVLKSFTIHFSTLSENGITVKSSGVGALTYQEISGLAAAPPTRDLWATIIVTNDAQLAEHIAAALNHAIDICSAKGGLSKSSSDPQNGGFAPSVAAPSSSQSGGATSSMVTPSSPQSGVGIAPSNSSSSTQTGANQRGSSPGMNETVAYLEKKLNGVVLSGPSRSGDTYTLTVTQFKISACRLTLVERGEDKTQEYGSYRWVPATTISTYSVDLATLDKDTVQAGESSQGEGATPGRSVVRVSSKGNYPVGTPLPAGTVTMQWELIVPTNPSENSKDSTRIPGLRLHTGSADLAPHIAKAVVHLIDLCQNQTNSDPF